MGANPSTSGIKPHYYSIVADKIVRQVTAETPGAVERTNSNDKVVHELKYDSLSGIITKVQIVRHEEFGDQLIITMKDKSELMVLTLPVKSSHFDKFALRIKNIPESMMVTIKPYDFKPQDSDRNLKGLNVFIGDEKGEKIPPIHDRENPIPVGQFPIDGDSEDKDMWSAKKRKFLKDIVLNEASRFVLPDINEEDMSGEEDDLPF